MEMKRFDEALNLFHRALEVDPEYAPAALFGGCAFAMLGALL